MDWCNLEVSCTWELGWSIQFHPDVHMFVWTRRSEHEQGQNGKPKWRFLFFFVPFVGVYIVSRKAIITPYECARSKVIGLSLCPCCCPQKIYKSNWVVNGTKLSKLAKNWRIWLVPASHDPWGWKIMMFVLHTYSPHATQLCIMTVHAKVLYK